MSDRDSLDPSYLPIAEMARELYNDSHAPRDLRGVAQGLIRTLARTRTLTDSQITRFSRQFGWYQRVRAQNAGYTEDDRTAVADTIEGILDYGAAHFAKEPRFHGEKGIAGRDLGEVQRGIYLHARQLGTVSSVAERLAAAGAIPEGLYGQLKALRELIPLIHQE